MVELMMQKRIDWIVEKLRKKGFNNFGIADFLEVVVEAQEVSSAAWTDALMQTAKEFRENPDDPGRKSEAA